jgi:hypothetical protein
MEHNDLQLNAVGFKTEPLQFDVVHFDSKESFDNNAY